MMAKNRVQKSDEKTDKKTVFLMKGSVFTSFVSDRVTKAWAQPTYIDPSKSPKGWFSFLVRRVF